MSKHTKIEEKVNALELQLQDVHEIIYVLGMALCDALAGACEFSHQPLPDIVVETKNKLNEKFSESKNTT